MALAGHHAIGVDPRGRSAEPTPYAPHLDSGRPGGRLGRHPARPERWLWTRQDGNYDIRCLACTTPGYGWPILRDGPERHPGELDQPAPAESITRHNGHLSRPGNPWTQLSVNRCCLGRRRPAMMHRRVTSGGAFWWDHTLSPCRREACWSTIGGLCRGTTAPPGWA